MIGKKVNVSRETEKQFIIHELNILGVYGGPSGESLDKVDYYTLRNMLAAQKAVRS